MASSNIPKLENDKMIVKRNPLPIIPEDWNTFINPVKSLRDAKSYSYFCISEASSAAQKAVRRGRWKEAIQWFLEMFYAGGDGEEGGPVRTNIWNRALVMAVEDIGPANPLLILKIYHLFVNHRNSELAIATTAKLLAESKKSRVNDWCLYLYMPNHSVTIANMIVDKEGGLDQIKALLVKALQERNIGSILYWSSVIWYTNYKVKRISKFRSCTVAKILVWEALEEVITDQNDILFVSKLKELSLSTNWRWSGKSRLIWSHIFNLWVNERMPSVTNDKLELNEELLPIIGMVKQRKGLLGVPDYALDKHTTLGRAKGRGLDHFFDIGSYLKNEDQDWKAVSDYYKEAMRKHVEEGCKL